MLTEGWDCPEVGCIMLTRPTNSLVLYRQMVGRVRRPAPHNSKTDALILDTAVRSSFMASPTMSSSGPKHGSLHRRSQCARSIPCTVIDDVPGVLRRAARGPAVSGMRLVTKPKHLQVADGELGGVDHNRSVHGSPQDRLTFYSELVAVLAEKRRGRPIRNRWVSAKFMEKFRSRPPRNWTPNSIGALTPSPATCAWVG